MRQTVPVQPYGQMIPFEPRTGALDLAMSLEGGVRILPTGTVAPGAFYAASDSSIGYMITAGDFNDDGKVDLAIAGWNPWVLPDGGLQVDGGLSVLFGMADGSFEAAIAVPSPVIDYLVPLGAVGHPRALAGSSEMGGIVVYGDPSEH